MRRTRVSLIVLAVVAASLQSGPALASASPTPQDPRSPSEIDLDQVRSTLAATMPAEQSSTSSPNSRVENIVTFDDPIGDVADARGDIVYAGANAAVTGNTAVLTEVLQYDDPLGTNWQTGATIAGWAFDVNGDTFSDYTAYFLATGGGVSAGVFDNDTNLVCAASPGWSAAGSYYAVVFPTSCITTGSTFAFYGSLLYEDVGTGELTLDEAPDSTWSPVVVNDAVAPPAPGGCTPGTVAPGSAPVDGFASLQPARLLDTRPGQLTIDCQYAGQGVRGAGSVLELTIAGRGGVPFGAQAAVLNITVTEPDAGGYLTVYPCGSPRPVASTLNFAAGQTVANASYASLGPTGAVCIFTLSRAHVVVDVNGYYLVASSFRALQPLRLLDTRGAGTGVPALARGSVSRVRVTGIAGSPTNASTAVLNVTVTEAGGNGYVTAFPCGAAMPVASNLNYVAGATVANAVVSKIGAGGEVCLFNSAPTHLVVDFNGYFLQGAALVPIVPARLMETRSGPGLQTVDRAFEGIGMRGRGSSTFVQVAGRANIPSTATTVILNVTAVDAAEPGYITVFPCGSSVPLASNLNVSTGGTVPNLVVSKIGASGRVCVWSNGATHVVLDVMGYYP